MSIAFAIQDFPFIGEDGNSIAQLFTLTAVLADTTGTLTPFTFPDAFPTACLGIFSGILATASPAYGLSAPQFYNVTAEGGDVYIVGGPPGYTVSLWLLAFGN